MLRKIKAISLLSVVPGLCILLSGWDSIQPHLVGAKSDADMVAGCGQIQFQFAKDGAIKDVQVLHSYPVGVYDNFMIDRVKKTNSSTSALVANIYDKDLSMVLYVDEAGKPTFSAKECRQKIGVKE